MKSGTFKPYDQNATYVMVLLFSKVMMPITIRGSSLLQNGVIEVAQMLGSRPTCAS